MSKLHNTTLHVLVYINIIFIYDLSVCICVYVCMYAYCIAWHSITQYQYSVIWYTIYKTKYPSSKPSYEQTSSQLKGARVGKLLRLLTRLRCWLTRWFHRRPWTDCRLSAWTKRWVTGCYVYINIYG